MDIAHAQVDANTPAQLAVDGKVEHGVVSRAVGVGGFLQSIHFDMTAENPEIRTRVLRRWPDQIGYRMAPDAELRA